LEGIDFAWHCVERGFIVSVLCEDTSKHNGQSYTMLYKGREMLLKCFCYRPSIKAKGITLNLILEQTFLQ
jgi:hypothetical protein